MNKNITVILAILVTVLLSTISAGITLGLIWVLWWALTRLGIITFAFSIKTAFLIWLVLWVVRIAFGVRKEMVK